MLKEKKLEFQ
jgi:adenylate kinase